MGTGFITFWRRPRLRDGIGSTVANDDFAFQEYFDIDGSSMMLDSPSSPTPLADAAYAKWFGNS